jgi:hypothetical protein
MTLVFCTGVALALLRDPNIRAALTGMALGSLLFLVAVSVMYFGVVCVRLIVRLFDWLRSWKWRSQRVSAVNDPS